MNISTAIQAPGLLLRDLNTARKAPILLAGLPRSGSSWTGTLLATGAGMRYFREPFNAKWHRYAEPFQFHYLRDGDANTRFDAYCRAAFEGRIGGPAVEKHEWNLYRRYSWWPGRVLIKEVHAVLALERIERLVHPRVVVIVRHPCALAASWLRLWRERPDDPMWRGVDDHISGLLQQQALLEDYLAPYVHVLQSAQTYLEKVGALWGAVYTVMLRQAANRPGWIVVTHEALSADPEGAFRSLFRQLDLQWTDLSDQRLEKTTSSQSAKPYATMRISSEESDKWRNELDAQQIAEVLQGARPFGIDLYSLN